MKPEFKKTINEIRTKCSFQSPIVKFSPELRNKFEDQNRLDYFEGMMTLLECHPFLPEYSFHTDILNFRKLLTYEIILRQLGHSRSIVANANVLNHIGTAVSLRCMLELYAFIIFLKETPSLKDEALLDKLLHGGILSSGEFYVYEKVYEEKYNEPLPSSFKDFLKTLLKTPQVNKYLKHAKSKDKGFECMYAIYSNYVHPTFGLPRDQFLEDIGCNNNYTSALDAYDYYLNAQTKPSPLISIKRDIDAAGFCMEMFWPELFELDPFFDSEQEINIFSGNIKDSEYEKIVKILKKRA